MVEGRSGILSRSIKKSYYDSSMHRVLLPLPNDGRLFWTIGDRQRVCVEVSNLTMDAALRSCDQWLTREELS